MKLFTKYNRINVVSTVIIFLLGCAAFSILLRYVIIRQVDEDLKIEKNEILTYVKNNNHLPSVVEVKDQYTTYRQIQAPIKSINKIFENKIYNKDDHKKELRRTIEFTVNANNNWYLASVSKSMESADELIKTIIIITITLILLILAATFIINRIILKKLWQPFYSTLSATQSFNLNDKQKIHFNTTNIDEFNYLNETVNQALSKAQRDYQNLKEFTENASHELQTPLAVIQSKLDILIQNEKLSEAESHSIQSAYNALQNLSKLNQSLLLLTKIENKQFGEQTNIDVKQLLQNKLNQFHDLWKSRNIQLQQSLFEKITAGNRQLMEVLLNNLLSNATKHNIHDGFVRILLNDSLEISNSGVAHALDETQLFKRFSTQSGTLVSHGLGLSIVQQICIVSGYRCKYNFNPPNMHTFKIEW